MRFKELIKNDIDPNYYETLAMVESSGNPNAKARTSTASGLYQFTEGTWQESVDRAGLNYTLEDRFNPEKSREVVEYLTKNNSKYLKTKLGKEPTSGDLYLAHFLGIGGARDLLLADSNAKVDSVVSKGALSANRSIFYNKDGSLKKVSDIKNWSRKKFGETYTPPQQSEIPDYTLNAPTSTVQVPYLAPYGEEETKGSTTPVIDQAVSQIDRRKVEMETLQQMMKANEVQYIEPEQRQQAPKMKEGGNVEQYESQSFATHTINNNNKPTHWQSLVDSKVDTDNVQMQKGGEVTKELDRETKLVNLYNSDLNKPRTFIEQKKWIRDWMENPEYEKRLSENLEEHNDSKDFGMKKVPLTISPFSYGKDFWDDEAEEIKTKAINKLKSTRTLHSPEESDKLAGELSKVLSDNKKYQKKDELILTRGVTGANMGDLKAVYINGQRGSGSKQSTAVHEYTHSTDMDKKYAEMIDLPQDFIDKAGELGDLRNSFGRYYIADPNDKYKTLIDEDELFEKIGYDKEETKYIGGTSEVYARLMSIRYENDIKPGEKITKEKLQEMKENSSERLYKIYSDDEIVNMLNKFADSGENKTKRGRIS